MTFIFKLMPFVLFYFTAPLYAQFGEIKGQIRAEDENKVLQGVSIELIGENYSSSQLSDSAGQFHFTALAPGKYKLTINKNNFETQEINCLLAANEVKNVKIQLQEQKINVLIEEMTVKADRPVSAASSSHLNKLDFENRPKNSAQDMLRLVPGLFIAQHAGGGKAEQIFIRGFDCDHGTDVASFVDGMPVNMPSHGHGQGYEDLHFLIPETVKGMEIFKGPYQAQHGNFATAAAVQFNTLDSLAQNMILLENTVVPTLASLTSSRVLALFQLPFSSKKISSYFATEIINNRSYFEKDQQFHRFNLFSKTVYRFNNSNTLSLSISAFSSSWDASGQVPDRAVQSQLISRFGSIDPTEGGATSRANLNLCYKAAFKGGEFVSQVYASHYRFKLFSNFTFFLEDSVNGDQIEQNDLRGILGMNTKYTKSHKLGKMRNRFMLGTSFRSDAIRADLWRATKRNRLNCLALSDINELTSSIFFNESLQFHKKLRLELGMRYDYSLFYVEDLLPGDSLRQNYSGSNFQSLVSPKVNLIYTANDRFQYFINFGKGFHSNDARSTVQQANKHQLPKSLGAELGTLIRPGKKIILSAALWTLNLENELVYVGDAGTTENKGSSRRIGIDFSARLQLSKNLFADADFNVSDNFFTKSLFGNRLEHSYHIPLAARATSAGGLSYVYKKMSINLRYRYMANRPANEDNTVIARGYTVLDFNLNYKSDRYKMAFGIENLLNTSWNEAQFDTESKLKNESQSVSELHFTPGTPFSVKLSISYLF